MSQFSKNLKKIRKDNKISQTQLSSYLGFRGSAIANYESGRNEPSFDTLIKLANYFDVTIDYMLGIEDRPKRFNEISKQEFTLLYDYRGLDQIDQKIVLDLASSLAQKNSHINETILEQK